MKEREGGKGKRWIRKLGNSVYTHACERLNTDSALGMSQWGDRHAGIHCHATEKNASLSSSV